MPLQVNKLTRGMDSTAKAKQELADLKHSVTTNPETIGRVNTLQKTNNESFCQKLVIQKTNNNNDWPQTSSLVYRVPGRVCSHMLVYASIC